MSSLKKHIVWILLGVILLAEVGFTVVLYGKRGTARKQRADLAAKGNRLAELKAQTQNYDAVIEALKARREAAEHERADAVLFLWQRDRLLERVFDDPAIAKYHPTPWTALTLDQMGSFRIAYQNAYDREVNALVPAMAKLRTDRDELGFAPPDLFSGTPKLVIGDIFAEQKEFWIRKEIVELAERVGVSRLVRITVDREGELIGAKRRAGVTLIGGAKPEGKLYHPIGIRIVLQARYPVIGEFYHALAASPLGFSPRTLEQIERSLLGSAERRRGAARPAATPDDEEAGTPVDTQVVSMSILCELPDPNVGVAEVQFQGKGLAKASDVKAWLDAEIKRLADALASGKLGDGLPASNRTYDFEEGEAAAWAASRAAYERIRVESRLALWRRARELLGDTKRVTEKPDGLVLSFKPKDAKDQQDYMDANPNKLYSQEFEIRKGQKKARVKVQLGLVTLLPKESPGGLRAARIGG